MYHTLPMLSSLSVTCSSRAFILFSAFALSFANFWLLAFSSSTLDGRGGWKGRMGGEDGRGGWEDGRGGWEGRMVYRGGWEGRMENRAIT